MTLAIDPEGLKDTKKLIDQPYHKQVSYIKNLDTSGKGAMAFCPQCHLYTPHILLSLDVSKTARRDRVRELGRMCRGCDSVNWAVRRDMNTGKVLKRYVKPGFRYAA